MNIEKLLTAAVVKAIKALYDTDVTADQVQVQKTRPDFEGHLTVVYLPPSCASPKKKPEETG